MNEITRIHLGRVPYNIDVDAKKELENYSKAIKKSLGADSDEVFDDIEIRMSEILAERGVIKDGVITLSDITAIREQLGEPRDFRDDDAAKSDEDWRDNVFARGKDDEKPAKKFYRDEDAGILGGLAAGLAAYTGWDVVLWRVIFLILIPITSGFAILAYIIMWVAAPAATTASEKLEMRGEAVNIDSIKESAKNFGEKAGEAGQKAATKTSEVARTAGPQLGHIVARIIAISAGVVLLMIAFGTLIGAVAGSFAIAFGAVIVGAGGVALLIVTIAGLLALFAFALFCFILALACFSGKFSKGYARGALITGLIILVASITSATSAGFWYSSHTADQRRQVWTEVQKRIDPRSEFYTDQLTVIGNNDVSVMYNAGDNSNATVNQINIPNVDTTKVVTIDNSNGNTAITVAKNWRQTCGETCPDKLEIVVSGQRANNVLANGPTVTYSVPSEGSVDFNVIRGSRLTIDSNNIGYSEITAETGTYVDASKANIATVDVDIDTNSRVDLDTPTWIDVDAIDDENCTGKPGVVNVKSVDNSGFNINDEYRSMAAGETFTSRCLIVNYGANQ